MYFNHYTKSFIINVKNSLTYVLIIAAYFFFVNLEVNKQEEKNNASNQSIDNSTEETEILNNYNLQVEDEAKKKRTLDELKISIPVIPYKE